LSCFFNRDMASRASGGGGGGGWGGASGGTRKPWVAGLPAFFLGLILVPPKAWRAEGGLRCHILQAGWWLLPKEERPP
jgi:hypothetical protein